MRFRNATARPLGVNGGFVQPGAEVELDSKEMERRKAWRDLGWLVPVSDAPKQQPKPKLTTKSKVKAAEQAAMAEAAAQTAAAKSESAKGGEES